MARTGAPPARDRYPAARASSTGFATPAWRYCDASARYLFAESAADPIGNRILDALRAAGGAMTQTEIYRSFGCNMPADKLAIVLATLQEHGRIGSERRKTGGKPRVTWKLLNYVVSSKKPPDRHPDLSNYYLLRNIEHREQPTATMPVDNSVSRPVDNFPAGTRPVDNSVATELARLAGLDVGRMLAGDFVEEDWPRIASAVGQLSERQPDRKADLAKLIEAIDHAYSAKVAP